MKRNDVLSVDILLVEAANVLGKKVRARAMTGEEAIAGLALIRSGVTRLRHSEPLIPRALELSIILSHPVYDCVFLACAEAEGGALATRDVAFVTRVKERGLGHLLGETP